MKIKHIVTALFVIIILASCAPAATSIFPPKTSSPPATFTIPAPSPTSAPTQISATPTETQPSNAEFLATTENVFPLVENETEINETGLVEFFGIIDFSQINYNKYIAPDGKTEIWASFTLEDGGVQFLVPTFWVAPGVMYHSLSWTTNSIDGYPSDKYLKNSMEQILSSLEIADKKVRVKLLLDPGLKNNTIARFGYADPFPQLWTNTNWDEAVRKFMETGDPNDLPKIDGFPLLPAVSIRQIVISN